MNRIEDSSDAANELVGSRSGVKAKE